MARSLTPEQALRAARLVLQLKQLPGWSEARAVKFAQALAKQGRLTKDGRIRPVLKRGKRPKTKADPKKRSSPRAG